MSKQLLNQRYIYKIKSDLFKRNKGKLTFKKEDIQKNMKQRYIVGLSDSTGMYLTRLMLDKKSEEQNFFYGSEEHINYLKEMIYLSSKEGDKNSVKRYTNEMLNASLQDAFCYVIFENDEEFDEYLDNEKGKGITINKKRYYMDISTPGALKKDTVMFIREDVYEQVEEMLNCGADFTEQKVLPSKITAYKALTFSGSNPVTDTDRVLVVKDVETSFKSDVVEIGFPDDAKEPIVELVKDKEIINNACDGCGMISPTLAKQWAIDLTEYNEETGEGYIPSGFCIRNCWTKGMVVQFNFVKYCEEKFGTTIFKDVWGQEKDLKEIDLILNESMLKLNTGFYKSWEDYNEKRHKYGYIYSVTKYTPKELEKERRLNYQYLQCLDISKEGIKELVDKDINEIKGVLGGDYRQALVYGKGKNLNDRNCWTKIHDEEYVDDYYTRALMIEPKTLNDEFVKGKLRRAIEKRIDLLKTGKVNVEGNYQIAIGEPILQLENMYKNDYDENFELRGLLKPEEFYIEYWREKGVEIVGGFRSPMTCRENAKRMNICSTEEAIKWYGHIKNLIIFNGWDTSMMAFNGEDFDGDMNFTTSNKIIINGIRVLPALDCASYSGEKMVNPTKEDYITGIKNSFGCAVGAITNWGSSAYDLLSTFKKGSDEYLETEKRIQSIQMIQQLSIDACKQGKKPKPIPSFWKNKNAGLFKPDKNGNCKLSEEKLEFYKKLVVDKKPYFFRYIYKAVDKDYKKWEKESNVSSLRNLGITYAELKNKDRNEEEEKLYQYLEREKPVSDNNCTVNWIAHYVEDCFEETFSKSKINQDRKEFNYSIYKDEEYNYALYSKKELDAMNILAEERKLLEDETKVNKKIISEVVKKYKEYKELVKARKENYDGMDKEEGKDSADTMYTLLRSDLLQLDIDRKTLVNIMIDMAYKTGKISVVFLWAMFGVDILDNLLRNKDYIIEYPKLVEEEGDFTYDGYNFKMAQKQLRRV